MPEFDLAAFRRELTHRTAAAVQDLRRRIGSETAYAFALFLEVDRKKIGRTVRGAPVRSYEEAERARGLPLLVAVGAPGARALIRAELAKAKFRDIEDYRCVA